MRSFEAPCSYVSSVGLENGILHTLCPSTFFPHLELLFLFLFWIPNTLYEFYRKKITSDQSQPVGCSTIVTKTCGEFDVVVITVRTLQQFIAIDQSKTATCEVFNRV